MRLDGRLVIGCHQSCPGDSSEPSLRITRSWDLRLNMVLNIDDTGEGESAPVSTWR